MLYEQSETLLASQSPGDSYPSHGSHTQPDAFNIDNVQARPFNTHSSEAAYEEKHTMLSNPPKIPKEHVLEPNISTRSLSSHLGSTEEIVNALGRPRKQYRYSALDLFAVISSITCLAIGVAIILPNLTIAWRMGFQSQIIAIGFLLGVMNICAGTVVPSCFVALEAYLGESRLQNFDAIITNKFLSSHIAIYWRMVIVMFLALPLGLSVGYKQFLGGKSSAELNPLVGQTEYGVSFPNIGDWAPIQDPIYLEFSADAAFHYASQNDTAVILNSSTNYPIAYGFNVLLLANDTAAILDLPTNNYLQAIRAKLTTGETWQITASVNAYVATRDDDAAGSLRDDDDYWGKVLNASDKGLVSYYLSQDVNSYVGMLAVVGQPSCWLGIFQGGPTTENMYSKSLDGFNIFGFRKAAHLFSLSRRRCEATWTVTASALIMTSGICDNDTTVGVSQEPVMGCASCPWSINGGPGLPHVFSTFVIDRKNSTWLLARYAVETATNYWARGVYEIKANAFQGFNYSGMNERIRSTRDTLDAAPLLFFCLAIQPMLTIAAFFTIMALSVPISGNFGLVAVLAGVKRPTLDLLEGAAFSGQLKRPLNLEIIVTERIGGELGGMPIAAVKYELKHQSQGKNRLSKADRNTLYL